MTTLELIGGILLIIISIIVIAVVVMQESKQAGVSVMGGQSDSYLSKNRGKTLESKLVTITKYLAIIFFVVTIAMNIIISNGKQEELQPDFSEFDLSSLIEGAEIVTTDDEAVATESDDEAVATESDDEAVATESDDEALATDSDNDAEATDSDDEAVATDSDDEAEATDSDNDAEEDTTDAE